MAAERTRNMAENSFDSKFWNGKTTNFLHWLVHNVILPNFYQHKMDPEIIAK